jgi:hypothetical protein
MNRFGSISKTWVRGVMLVASGLSGRLKCFECLSVKWFLSVQPGVKLGFRKINPARLAREDRSVRNRRKLLTGGGK